jgi:hypothetical protein
MRHTFLQCDLQQLFISSTKRDNTLDVAIVIGQKTQQKQHSYTHHTTRHNQIHSANRTSTIAVASNATNTPFRMISRRSSKRSIKVFTPIGSFTIMACN